MDEFARAAFREREARRILRRRVFWLHASIYLATNVALFVVWALVGGGYPWFVFPILGWGILVVAHAAAAFLMVSTQDLVLEREQRRLSQEQ
jgi:hypothetical protein